MEKMKNYLSFGGGVNSVAMLLLLHEQKWDFEAVFVDHKTDWPETYEYLEMLQVWLEKKGLPRITILSPSVTGYGSLYDYCWHYQMVPSFMFRWCTDKFKLRAIYKHCEAPAFMCLGIDAGEAKRAKLSINKGFENRFPLIEAGLDRGGCKTIIAAAGLPLPMKSGCFICPYQRVEQWKQLRTIHPELFCKAEQLEKRTMEYRTSINKPALFLSQSHKAPLSAIVNEKQSKLWEADEYPPCNCML